MQVYMTRINNERHTLQVSGGKRNLDRRRKKWKDQYTCRRNGLYVDDDDNDDDTQGIGQTSGVASHRKCPQF